MSVSLITAALLMGLASTPHCATMCGAPCAAVTRACSGARHGQALLGWHLGRAFAYTAAGAVAAGSVQLLGIWAGASAMLKPIWTLMQVAMLMLGGWLLLRGQMPRWIDGFSQTLARRLQPAGAGALGSGNGLRRAAVVGSAWVALPCGVLWGALAVAALAGTPTQGAAVMLAFSLGSAVGLAGVPLLLGRLAGMPHHGALRVAGALVVAAAGWALWHGVEGAVAGWCVSA